MRASRVVQFVLIGLGFIAFGLMFFALHIEGPDYGFHWSCGKDGDCVGETSETPSGFQDGVTLGLLGIGFEVAAVAIGVGARPANASTAPPNHAPGQLAAHGYPQAGAASVPGSQPFPPAGPTTPPYAQPPGARPSSSPPGSPPGSLTGSPPGQQPPGAQVSGQHPGFPPPPGPGQHA